MRRCLEILTRLMWAGIGCILLMATPAIVQAAPQAAAVKFDIWQFIVLGNHVLPQTAVESVVYPFLGPDRDFDTVQQAADALGQAYKKAGYATVYVTVPVQEVSNGTVRLQVTEGHIQYVNVHGARYFSEGKIVAALPALTPGQTPLFTQLQSQLAKLNSQTPDRFVTPVLNAGTQPGTVDVDLNVKDRLPLHGTLSYDDRHTADTTPNRMTATLAYNNLFDRLDSLSLIYQTAPANRQNATVESATYMGHVPNASGMAAFSYTHTTSNVLALGTLGVLGKGNIYGLHWLQPLPSSDTFSQNLDFGGDYKSVRTVVKPDVPPSDSDNTAASAAASAPVTAPVKYINWSTTYSAGLRFPTRTFTTSFGVNWGISDIVDRATQFNNARYDAAADYLDVRFSETAIQSLPKGLAILGRVTGQWADSPLVNNEQFSLGGEDTVRGYLEAETLGDTGAAGTLELHSPDFGHYMRPVLTQFYVFGFVDAGVATLLDALPGQDWHESLWSTGAGMQLAGPGGLIGSLDYAIPEKDGIRTHKHHGRIDFSVRFGF